MNVTARCAFESEDISDTLARDLAEVDYFLRDERAAMRTFMHDLTRGAFTSVDHLLWLAELLGVYADRHARCAPFRRRSTRERRDVRSGRPYNRT